MSDEDYTGARRGRARPQARRTRRKERRGSRARRGQLRQSRAVRGFVLEFCGLGDALELAAGATGTYTVRAQRENVPVALFLDETQPDCTIETWSIAGSNVFRGSGGVPVAAFHPRNTQRAAYAWPKWGGGTDMVITIKNNHAATERVVSGGMLVLTKRR